MMKLTAKQWHAAEKRLADMAEYERKGWLLWSVKVATIERLWKQMAHGYFGRRAEQERKDVVCEHILERKPHTPPQVVFQTGDRPGCEFFNGCHRFAVVRDSGAKDLLVLVPWGRATKAMELGVKLVPVGDAAKAAITQRQENIAISKKCFAESKKRHDKMVRLVAKRKAQQK